MYDRKLIVWFVYVCVQVYTAVEREMLPTPAKSHYTFNLRDLSKVGEKRLYHRPLALPNPAECALAQN